MTKPLISILVPNFRNKNYLARRFDSILNQSVVDYEVVVCDSYSDDGAWELIQEYAAADDRIRCYRVAREGIYAGWNECLRRAQGEYVYMATSDDTMSSDCLGKLLAILIKNPECSISMCALNIIDESDRSLPADRNWRSFPAGNFFGTMWDHRHVRFAPLDGALSGSLHCIWHSATQLLVKLSVYEKHGFYRTDLGSIGDFEWNTRVAMFENVVYIPEVLATLRVHGASASVQRGGYTADDMDEKIKVLDEVINSLKIQNPVLAERLLEAGWIQPFRFQQWIYRLRSKPVKALAMGCNAFYRRPWAVIMLLGLVLRHALKGKEALRAAFARQFIQRMGLSLSTSIRFL